MDTRHPVLPEASVEELRELAAALQEGESVRWAVRAERMRTMSGLPALIMPGFGLAITLFALMWAIGLSAEPSSGFWVEKVFFFLFTWVPVGMMACAALWCFSFPWLLRHVDSRSLCVLTERRALCLSHESELPSPLRLWQLFSRRKAACSVEALPLRAGMAYQIHIGADGRSGQLIFNGDAGRISDAVSSWHLLPDVRAAEAALLSIIRPQGVEHTHTPLSLYLSTSTREEAEQAQNALCRDESLLWAERPRPQFFPLGEVCKFFFFCVFALFALFFSALITGFPTTGAELAAVEGETWLAVAFCALFLLIGLLGMTRPLLRRRAMARSVYLLTTRRALVLEPAVLGGWKLFAYPLRDNLVTRRRARADGSGDLVFSRGEENADIDLGCRGFINVPDLARAERELAAAAGKAQA